MQAQAGQAVILDISCKIKLPLNFRLLVFICKEIQSHRHVDQKSERLAVTDSKTLADLQMCIHTQLQSCGMMLSQRLVNLADFCANILKNNSCRDHMAEYPQAFRGQEEKLTESDEPANKKARIFSYPKLLFEKMWEMVESQATVCRMNVSYK